MTSIAIDKTAEKEKASAALSSVVAAIFLTGFKIVVGLMTNSLGILAEAAHSSLDLVAAVVTYIAVRVSGRPPDKEHQYGHGKIENISALFETLLLLVTCVWIIYESIQRLFFKDVEVEASFWAFTVMFVSIAVDFSRSRILYRAARKHNSHALEADALHFKTDIWSSSVVILGLVGVRLAAAYPQLAFLHKADAIAALVVAVIVIYISFELGTRNIQALLDQSPRGLVDQIEKVVSQVPGVQSCHQVRIRPSGPNTFIDIHIVMDPTKQLEEVHLIMDQVENTIQEIAPKADITVHPEPQAES
jgi:cation diffusion facilitator family transporter